MNIPGFTAQASLYQTSRHYRASASSVVDLHHSHFVTLAYHPTSHKRCDDCLTDCLTSMAWLSIGSVVGSWVCAGRCALGPQCCPKRCGEIDPGDLTGGGCCDADEQCVDESDPNSRSGCCPSGQSVCGGRCCGKGATCCGDECCPESWFCDNGFCTQSAPFPSTPPPPPPPFPIVCAPDSDPCQRLATGGWFCCPPGLECCDPGICRRWCVG